MQRLRHYAHSPAFSYHFFSPFSFQAFGNHEFDNKISGLLPFVRGVNFSLVCANMDVSQEPLWPQKDTIFKKSSIFTLNGQKIGVIGYISKETTWFVVIL